MTRNAEAKSHACLQFVQNIARIGAHGDRLKDGTEVIWDEHYAAAQLWEVIYNARLLSGAFPNDSSAFHTATRRADSHTECVRTYPDNQNDASK